MHTKDLSPCVRKAIISHWALGRPYSEIAGLINDSKIASISKGTVWYTIKRFRETDSCETRPGKGRKRTVRTPRLVRSVHQKIRRTPKRSMRKLGLEAEISKTSMWRIVRNDLNMTPFKFRKRQLLNEVTMAKRLTRGRFLLKWMKINPGIPVIWSDEKLFTVEMDFNHHNDRVLSVRVEDIPVDQRTVFKRQSPASVMVWA